MLARKENMKAKRTFSILNNVSVLLIYFIFKNIQLMLYKVLVTIDIVFFFFVLLPFFQLIKPEIIVYIYVFTIFFFFHLECLHKVA